MELVVLEGDIAAVEADAIANAANDRLWMGAGVAGALKRAGGEEIEREAMRLGPIAVGSAVATTAGRLKARWVIHGAVMGQDLRTNLDLVRKTTRACLALADELGCESLALPAFGTGVGGLALPDCARAMVDGARRYEPASLRRVIFAVIDGSAFEEALRGYDAGMRDEEDEDGRFAVRGDESHESEETLSPDEGGDDPREPPAEPKQPNP